MPCIICKHTLENIGAQGRRLFWCPRCGTLHEQGMERTETETPLLVNRVLVLAGKVRQGDLDRQGIWLAVKEAVGLYPEPKSAPEEGGDHVRPTP